MSRYLDISLLGFRDALYPFPPPAQGPSVLSTRALAGTGGGAAFPLPSPAHQGMPVGSVLSSSGGAQHADEVSVCINDHPFDSD